MIAGEFICGIYDDDSISLSSEITTIAQGLTISSYQGLTIWLDDIALWRDFIDN